MIAYCLLPLLVLAPSRHEIREMVERAEAAYKLEQWDTASRAFADAYAVDPNPDYLFARAQAERFSGRCNVSVKLWDQYIAVETSAESLKEAREFRRFCEPLVAAATAPPTASASATADDAAHPRSNAWYRDPSGGVLVATGGVSMVIGASVLGLALSRDRKAASADTEGSYVTRKDGVRPAHQAGIAVLSVGSALLVAGVIRWAVVASRARSRRAQAGATSSWGGAARGLTRGLRVAPHRGTNPPRWSAALSLGVRF